MHNYQESRDVPAGGRHGVQRAPSFRPSPRSCRTSSRSNVYNSINFDFSYEDPNNFHGAMMTVINGFICPSDLPDPIPSLGGQTNYMANMGSWIVWQAAMGPNAGLPPPNGVFYGDSATTFAAITDGLSNTTFYSERVLADGNNCDRQPDRRRLLLAGFPMTLDDGHAAMPGGRYLQPEQPVPAVHGRPWLCGQHIFLHVTPPNTRPAGSSSPSARSCPPAAVIRAA